MGAAEEFAAPFLLPRQALAAQTHTSAPSTDLYFAMSPCKQVGCVSAGTAPLAVRKNPGQRDLDPRFA